jgi:hypothetical protein
MPIKVLQLRLAIFHRMTCTILGRPCVVLAYALLTLLFLDNTSRLFARLSLAIKRIPRITSTLYHLVTVILRTTDKANNAYQYDGS